MNGLNSTLKSSIQAISSTLASKISMEYGLGDGYTTMLIQLINAITVFMPISEQSAQMILIIAIVIATIYSLNKRYGFLNKIPLPVGKNRYISSNTIICPNLNNHKNSGETSFDTLIYEIWLNRNLYAFSNSTPPKWNYSCNLITLHTMENNILKYNRSDNRTLMQGTYNIIYKEYAFTIVITENKSKSSTGLYEIVESRQFTVNWLTPNEQQFIDICIDSLIEKKLIETTNKHKFLIIEYDIKHTTTCYLNIPKYSKSVFDDYFDPNKQEIIDWCDNIVNVKIKKMCIFNYGPPGTGKSSLIRKIMEYVQRSCILNVNLTTVKTKKAYLTFSSMEMDLG